MKHALGLAIAALAAGCGGEGDPFCGDGRTDEGEECDDGNDDDTDFCRACTAYLPPRTTVKWRFNAEAAPGFTQDNCNDTRTSRVQVALTPGDHVLDAMCSVFQVVFDDLPPGPYTAAVTPLDSDGNSLVHAPVTQQITAADSDVEDTINVPPDAWIGPYTGSFFFAVTFGGVDCDVAAPPVDEVVITLRVGGDVVTQMTTDGQALDGSAPGPCVPASGPDISALGVPFGPATIQIVGRDGVGGEQFRGDFDTFVGAGPSNPTLVYDVLTIYDAMPPDATPPPDAI